MLALRILKIVAIAFLVLVLVLLVALWLVNFGFLKPQIEQAVSDTTGREFSIDGDLKIKLLPRVRVSVNQASMASPAWSAQDKMLNVDKFEADVSVWSLLSPPVVIHKFQLSGVDVLVELNPQQELNWDIAPPPEPEKEPDPNAEPFTFEDFPLEIRSANFDDIAVTVREPGTEDMTFALDSFDIQKQSESKTQLDASAQLRDLPLMLDGRVDSGRLLLDLKVDDVELNSTFEFPPHAIAFDATLGALSDLGEILETEGLPAEDLTVSGKIVFNEKSLALENIVAELSGVRAAINGFIQSADNSVQIDGLVSGEKLSYFSDDLPELAYSLKTKLKVEGEIIELDPFELKLGESDVTGNARLVQSEKPSVMVNLQSELLDLSPFAAEETEPSEAKQDESESAEQDSTEYVFTEDPLPLEQLEALDAEINAEVARLVHPSFTAVDLQSNLKLKEGELDISNVFEGEHGGSYQSGVKLVSAGAKSTLKVQTDIKDLKLGLISGGEVPTEDIPPTSVEVALDATGATARDMAASLDGRVFLHTGSGKVSNDLMETFSGDILAQLLSALNPFAKSDEFSNWDCSIIALGFDSGLGEVQGFLLQSEKLMIVGGGKVDLNDETLKFEFNTKPRQGVGVSADMFVTPFVDLTGTLSSPSVGLNEKGVLLSGGAAVLTGGMSFLYKGLMDRATAEGDRCAKTLESVEQQVTGTE